MIRRPSLKRTALLAAALQMVLSFGLALNLVVCCGTGGHVAVESVLADCCTSHSPSATSRSVSSTSACNGCIDTPLFQTVLQRDPDSIRGLLLLSQSLPIGFPSPLFVRLSTVAVRPVPVSIRNGLSTHRFVVLLI
jgi:hypothetical protein